MHLDNNDLKTPPKEVVMKGTSEVISYLERIYMARETRILELSFLDLTTLPVEYLGITNVTELSLSDNQIQALSPEIGSLTDIRRLWLQNNLLATLPPSVRSLTRLVALCLDKNRFESFPPMVRYLHGS